MEWIYNRGAIITDHRNESEYKTSKHVFPLSIIYASQCSPTERVFSIVENQTDFRSTLNTSTSDSEDKDYITSHSMLQEKICKMQLLDAKHSTKNFFIPRKWQVTCNWENVSHWDY